MFVDGLLSSLTRVKEARSARLSSWDRTGRNADSWMIEPGEVRVLGEIEGSGCINHIWMTQGKGYRKVLLRLYWDDEEHPSVLCPLGDFFGLGHELVNSYDSLLFSASTNHNNQFNAGCALNSYVQMPFNKSARVELVNESDEPHRQYFYIDYETYDRELDGDVAYFHARFRRENPCDGWGHEISVNILEADIVNKERLAWDNNYAILDARGRGHYNRLQSLGHQLPGHVVGRRRRHDLGGRLQVAAGPSRHRIRGLPEPGLGHAAQRVSPQRVVDLRGAEQGLPDFVCLSPRKSHPL